MDRPSGETVRERDVHDLPSGMKDVITASLVSLRTLAFPWPSAMTNPKRPSSTPAVGDGVRVAEGVCVADGLATTTVGDDGAFEVGWHARSATRTTATGAPSGRGTS